jgi:hypothetical protein
MSEEVIISSDSGTEYNEDSSESMMIDNSVLNVSTTAFDFNKYMELLKTKDLIRYDFFEVALIQIKLAQAVDIKKFVVTGWSKIKA